MLDAAVLVPALPLGGFLVLLLAGRRLGDPRAGWLATAVMAASFVAAGTTFVGLLSREAEERSFTQTLFTWVSVGGLEVKAALLVDPLSITMALFVTGVGTLIHLYSVGYMHGDDGFPRFFVYLNLFAFSMLVLVMADNLVFTFLGWEGVGACSYFLISFWFTRDTAASAGKKAFVTNRIGDFGFMVATFLTFAALGSLTYSVVLGQVDTLSESTATAIALLLFLGAVGKSAQLPLYVWLPDAMEGPTPVSALIHAATMVTAGVYLMARVSPLLEVADAALTVIAWVGVLTALYSATIACAQDDIKRVLAYSTISQLGYMFLAVGVGAYVAAVFHMVTHAFFKALLFLGAGSVIHGLHDEQDMKHMGGLRRWMPITSVTFIAGWLAIAGVPPLAGFWSKDEILVAAWDENVALWAVGLVTALLTAYYMSRQVFLVFYGDERWWAAGEVRSEVDAAAQPEHEPVAASRAGGGGHAGRLGGAHARGDLRPHESPWVMWVPLAVLAGLSVIGGALNWPVPGMSFVLEHFLEPVFGEHELEVATGTKVVLALVAAAASLAGIALARGWARRAEQPALEPGLLRRAWGVDSAYARVVAGPGRWLADLVAYGVDAGVVDGVVNGSGTVVRLGAAQLRRLQTGYVRNYALGVAVGAVVLLGYVITRAAL